jgi:hypothetical protein
MEHDKTVGDDDDLPWNFRPTTVSADFAAERDSIFAGSPAASEWRRAEKIRPTTHSLFNSTPDRKKPSNLPTVMHHSLQVNL